MHILSPPRLDPHLLNQNGSVAYMYLDHVHGPGGCTLVPWWKGDLSMSLSGSDGKEIVRERLRERGERLQREERQTEHTHVEQGEGASVCA